MQKQLEHLAGIKWVGDLSLQDADLLSMYGKSATNVLEHGSGGSTMILGQTAKYVLTLEESDEWRQVTQSRLNKLKLFNVDLPKLDNFESYFLLDTVFDLMFVDGRAGNRYDFILKNWNKLSDQATILIHDTRKIPENSPYCNSGKGRIHNIHQLPQKIITHFSNEIGSVYFNACASNGIESNITVIKKKEIPHYVFWQEIEDKPLWSYGSDLTVEEFWEYK